MTQIKKVARLLPQKGVSAYPTHYFGLPPKACQ